MRGNLQAWFPTHVIPQGESTNAAMNIQGETADQSSGDTVPNPHSVGRMNNLPLQLTSFVGREREIKHITQLLGEARLLTLTGVGGVGKTRLGLQVASHQLNQYEHGVWVVDLGSLYEPQIVVHKVASTLGSSGRAVKSRQETLIDFLMPKQMLLLLDNCEHLVDACAELVTALLMACPDLQVLATSREQLGVPGELVYEIPPLTLPDPVQDIEPSNLNQFEAIQLFLERAGALQHGFIIDDQTAAAIVQICRMLDGIPLAVELAAARVRVLSPSQIAEYLPGSLQFLTSGDRTAVSRHQTLQASIDWSYTMLSEKEKVLFRRLAVFAGEFLLDDAQAVCMGRIELVLEEDASSAPENIFPSIDLKSADIIELLSNLVDKSLIRATPGKETIYRLLNPIQHYGWVALGESSERQLLQERHLDYYLEVAEQFHPIRKCSDLSNCFRRLDIEIDNFRAALDWASQSNTHESGLRLASLLGEYWWRHGYAPEGLEWIKRFLSSYADVDITRAKALLQAGRLSREGGDYKSSNSILEESLQICQKHHYQAGIAEATCQLGVNAHYLGDQERGIEMLEKGLEIYRELGDDWNVASKQLYLGDAYRMRGDNQKSTASYREGLSLFEKLKDKWGTGWALGGLGVQARLRGDYQGAVEFFSRSLELHVELGDKWDIAFSMEAKAKTLAELGVYRQAAVLWGFTESLRESTQSVIPPSFMADYVSFMDAARAELGEVAFGKAWQEGRKLTFEQARSLAVQPLPDDLDIKKTSGSQEVSRSTRVKTIQRYELTGREVEVLRLVAQGLTDAQVAEELVISPRTVSKHLQSIYGKLQVNSRSAATRLALEQKIVS